MSEDLEERSVRDILMCVIGEALMLADASFLFGSDFDPIIKKYAPILQHKPPTTEILRKEINDIRMMIAAINASTPFLGESYSLLQEKINDLEYNVCDDPLHMIVPIWKV